MTAAKPGRGGSTEAKPKISAQPRRPRGRPRTEDLAALEARFRLVARELFFRDGYGATTMSDIAEAARTSKRTLYARFPSKAALLHAIVEEQVESWDTGVHHTPIDGCETLRDFLLAYGAIAMRAGMSRDFLQLDRLLHSESGRFPELAEIAEARFRRGVEYLSQNIRAFAESDGVPCRDPDFAAEHFMTTMMGRTAIIVVADRTVRQAEVMDWLERIVAGFLAGRAGW